MKFPLFVRRGGAPFVLAVSLLVSNAPAQRPAPKPTTPTKPAPTTQATTTATAENNPSITFDTLLSADAYGVYVELRAVGMQANSDDLDQLLTPLRLQGVTTPDEMFVLYDFIRTHADALATARVLVATMPVRAGLPEMLMAVEMPSVEEARKFTPELRKFIAANIAPTPDAGAVTTTRTSASTETPAARRRARRGARVRNAATEEGAKQAAAPSFQIKRAGNLIALSGEKFTFKDLHGTQQALLVNEPGFQAARTRFSGDALFIYFNTVRMASSTKQRTEAFEKEYRRQEELARAEAEKQGAQSNANTRYGDIVEASGGNANIRVDGNTNASATLSRSGTNANVAVSPEDELPPPPPTPEATPTPKTEQELEEERRREQSQQFAMQLSALVFGRGGSSGEAWPESIGIGVSLEAASLVVRGLFISQSAEQPLRPIPFLPVLLSGPSISAEAAAVMPNDTDIFVSVSLDLPQMYDYVASLMKIADLATAQDNDKNSFGGQLASFERTNNFRIREELIAALGNEIAVGLPGNQLFGGRATSARRKTEDESAPPPPSGPIVVVALNDKESLQKLLPRVLSAFGFTGATEQSILERHGQVEVLTFSNGTLAFIDRFLVGTPDAATMRRVTEAYNRGETLANSERFREPTRWQSRDSVGQLYVANALLKGIFDEAIKSVDDIDEPAIRAYLTRLDPNPGAITLVSTRDTDGLMHELHLPKNLISLFAASELVNQKLSVMRSNEYTARWKLQQISESQTSYKEAKGRYGTLEELKDGFLNEESVDLETTGYDIKLSVSGDRFEATATPTGYPKQGRRSFYIDQTGQLRGADTGGKPATQSTPIID
ncbi:MAG TPA: hypothetical protein VGW12_12960 [Pyrinomonadaceae bacterium]|nr:hypothetical protein [Pyrinomonadaceae bacterium]